MYLALIVALIFSGCGNPELEIVTSIPVKNATIQIDSVDVYVDCSGSMKGYVTFLDKDVEEADPSFLKNVPKFIINLEQFIENVAVSIYKVKNGAMVKEPSIDAFITGLRLDRQFFSGNTTELPEMITNIVKNQGKNSDKLSVLITDGVLSFGLSELRRDSMHNLRNMAELEHRIHLALSKDTTLSMAIVKYLSNFNGDYYYNCKEQVKYSKKLLANRPFYLFVIGKKELVSSFLSRENLLPQSEGVYTVSSPVELEVALFKKKNEQVEGTVNSDLRVTANRGTIIPYYEKDDDKVFIVGIKKSSVPRAYYTDEETFFADLKCDDKNVLPIKKLSNAADADGVDENEKLNNPNKVQDYDYFYKITIDKKMFDNDVSNKVLTFYFEPSLDIAASHTDKDYGLEDISELEHKTWGLGLISGGIESANAGKKPQGAIFTLTLNKIEK